MATPTTEEVPAAAPTVEVPTAATVAPSSEAPDSAVPEEVSEEAPAPTVAPSSEAPDATVEVPAPTTPTEAFEGDFKNGWRKDGNWQYDESWYGTGSSSSWDEWWGERSGVTVPVPTGEVPDATEPVHAPTISAEAFQSDVKNGLRKDVNAWSDGSWSSSPWDDREDGQWAGSQDKWAGSQDKWAESQDKWAGGQDKWGKWAGSQDKWAGSQDKWAGSQDMWADSQDMWADNKDKWGKWAGSQDKWAGSQDKWAESQDKWPGTKKWADSNESRREWWTDAESSGEGKRRRVEADAVPFSTLVDQLADDVFATGLIAGASVALAYVPKKDKSGRETKLPLYKAWAMDKQGNILPVVAWGAEAEGARAALSCVEGNVVSFGPVRVRTVKSFPEEAYFEVMPGFATHSQPNWAKNEFTSVRLSAMDFSAVVTASMKSRHNLIGWVHSVGVLVNIPTLGKGYRDFRLVCDQGTVMTVRSWSADAPKKGDYVVLFNAVKGERGVVSLNDDSRIVPAWWNPSVAYPASLRELNW